MRAQRYAALYSPRGYTDAERAEMQLADLLMCATYPLYFIDQWGWLRAEKQSDPDLVETPFITWPKQRELADWLTERIALEQTAAIPKSRELGVTWLILWLRLHAWRFPAFSTRLVSRKEELVDRRHDMNSLFEKVRYGIGKLPPHLWPSRHPRFIDNHLILKNLDNRAEISGESTAGGSTRGGRVQVLYFDEFAEVEERVAQEIWMASESVAACRVVVWNAKGKRHKSFELLEGLSPEQVFQMTWQCDPYRDEEWKRRKILPLGGLTEEEFEVEYNCSHEAVGGFRVWRFNREAVIYADSTDGWREAQQQARAAWDCLGGWDFGSGYSLLACPLGLVDWTNDPRRFVIRIDDMLVWEQTAWQQAAVDARQALGRYGGRKIMFADPGGSARESDQMSWITNMQSAGLPMFALAAAVNAEEPAMWGRKQVQALLDQGRLLFNASRCGPLLEAMALWQFNVPQGITKLEHYAGRYLKPKKDVYSHLCEALVYLVHGAVMMAAEHLRSAGGAKERNALPLRGSGSVAGWSGLHRGLLRGGED